MFYLRGSLQTAFALGTVNILFSDSFLNPAYPVAWLTLSYAHIFRSSSWATSQGPLGCIDLAFSISLYIGIACGTTKIVNYLKKWIAGICFAEKHLIPVPLHSKFRSRSPRHLLSWRQVRHPNEQTSAFLPDRSHNPRSKSPDLGNRKRFGLNSTKHCLKKNLLNSTKHFWLHCVATVPRKCRVLIYAIWLFESRYCTAAPDLSVWQSVIDGNKNGPRSSQKEVQARTRIEIRSAR